jgi:hypothetical protein
MVRQSDRIKTLFNMMTETATKVKSAAAEWPQSAAM